LECKTKKARSPEKWKVLNIERSYVSYGIVRIGASLRPPATNWNVLHYMYTWQDPFVQAVARWPIYHYLLGNTILSSDIEDLNLERRDRMQRAQWLDNRMAESATTLWVIKGTYTSVV